MDEAINEQLEESGPLKLSLSSPEDLTEEDIAVLSESLIASTFDLFELRAEKSRMKLKNLIYNTRDKLQAIIPRAAGLFKNWPEELANLAYPGYTLDGFRQFYQHRIRELMLAGELMVGKLNGEVVGVIGFYKWGEFEGRDIYETTKGTVLPDYRGKGYYKKIKDALMSHLRQTHADSPIMAVSKNAIIIEYMRKYYPETQEIPLNSNHPLGKELQKQIGEPEFSKMVDKGNLILWYDPMATEITIFNSPSYNNK